MEGIEPNPGPLMSVVFDNITNKEYRGNTDFRQAYTKIEAAIEAAADIKSIFVNTYGMIIMFIVQVLVGIIFKIISNSFMLQELQK